MSPHIHIERRGAGDPLVLLHGWGLNVRVWDGLAAELENDFQLILLDLPGHGASPWSAAAETLAGQARLIGDALIAEGAHERRDGAARPALLGWSLGGQLAMELVRQAPGSFEALVLAATTPKFQASDDWRSGLPPQLLQTFAALLGTDYRRTLADFLELQVRGSADSAAVLSRLRGALLRQGEACAPALEAALRILASTDLRGALAQLDLPTLVISGQYDRVTPPTAGRALAGGLPQARYLEFRRAGHAPFLSHGPEFAESIRTFLRGARVELQARDPFAAPARPS